MESSQVPSLIQEVLAAEEKRAQQIRDNKEIKCTSNEIWHNGRRLLDTLGAEWQNEDDLYKEERQQRFHEEILLVEGRPFLVVIREHREIFLSNETVDDVEIGLKMLSQRYGINRFGQGKIYQINPSVPRSRSYQRFETDPKVKDSRQYKELLEVVMSQREVDYQKLTQGSSVTSRVISA